MTTEISAVLFDADGVIQSYGPFADQCSQLGWAASEYQSLLDAIFGHELFPGCLEGRSDFFELVESALHSQNYRGLAREFLTSWLRTITLPNASALELVAQLRSDGVMCCLATNQDPERASYMEEVLGYQDLFDHSFYSCRLGVAKPDPGYFAAALAELGCPASEVLFLDDTEPNVVAARQVGLLAEVVTTDSDLADLLGRHGLPFRTWDQSEEDGLTREM